MERHIVGNARRAAHLPTNPFIIDGMELDAALDKIQLASIHHVAGKV